MWENYITGGKTYYLKKKKLSFNFKKKNILKRKLNNEKVLP